MKLCEYIVKDLKVCIYEGVPIDSAIVEFIHSCRFEVRHILGIMAIKTEILQAIGDRVRELGVFKLVKRGLVNVNSLTTANIPAFVYNSSKLVWNDRLSQSGRLVMDMYIEALIVDKKSSTYFEALDKYEELILTAFNCPQPQEIHPNLFDIAVLDINEVINDEQLDNRFALELLLKATYLQPVG